MLLLLKNHLLLRSILFKPSAFFADSSSQNIQRNKAILASQIIHTIKNSPLNEYRSDSPCPSLRQKILDQIETYETDAIKESEKQQVTSAVKYALIKYFVDGVWVPYYMCNQKKFYQEKKKKYEYIKKLNEQVEMYIGQNEKNIGNLEFKKLQFCPTYFVTGQVFRYIFDSSDYLLLTGQYGVGKTYSFVLYTLLSEIIFRYRHKYCSSKRMTELPSGISGDIPKAFYWCVNISSNQHSPFLFNKIIQRHIYQLKQTEFSKNILKTQEDNNIKTLLWNHYGMNTVLLMDQISQMASAVREYESYQQQVKSTGKKAFKKKIQKENIQVEEAQTNYDKFKLYKAILQKIICNQHFDRILYLSSVDIQRHLLRKLHLLGSSKMGNIQNYRKRISYPTKLYSDISISDSAEFIAFLLKLKWIGILQRDITTNEYNLLSKIKKQLQINLRKESFVFMLPLSMREKIKDLEQTSYKKLQKQEKNGKLRESVFKIMKSIQDHSAGEMITKLKQFLLKQLPNKDLEKLKPIILIEFWGQSKNLDQKAQYQKNEDKSEQEKSKEIWQKLPALQFQFQNKEITKVIEPAMPHKLFGYQGQKLVCFVNPIILHRVIHKNRQSLYNAVLASNQPILKHVYSYKSSLGKFIQSIIIDILSKKGTTFQYKQSRKTNRSIGFLNIQHTGIFVPIPKSNQNSYKDFCFLSSFVSSVKQLTDPSKANQQFQILSVPARTSINQSAQLILKDGINNEQIFYQSKLVDFAITSYIQTDAFRGLEVNALDVTISESEHKEKVENFIEELINFKDQYDKVQINGQKVDITLKYVVITTAKLDNFNCKVQLEKKIAKFQKEISSLKDQKLQEALQKLKAMKELQLQDYGNLCKISRRKSQILNEKSVFSSITVVSLFDDIEFKNQQNIQSIDLEMRLIEKLRKEAKSKSKTTQSRDKFSLLNE